MGKIIEFTGNTLVDIEPDKILSGAKGKLKKVIIVGYDEDGLYVASSSCDIGHNLLLLERARDLLLDN